MPTLMRSRVTMAVHVTLAPPVDERVIRIEPGTVVDFDEIVRPARPGRDAFTLGQAVAHRLDCFEACGVEGASPAGDPPLALATGAPGAALDPAMRPTTDVGSDTADHKE